MFEKSSSQYSTFSLKACHMLNISRNILLDMSNMPGTDPSKLGGLVRLVR